MVVTKTAYILDSYYVTQLVDVITREQQRGFIQNHHLISFQSSSRLVDFLLTSSDDDIITSTAYFGVIVMTSCDVINSLMMQLKDFIDLKKIQWIFRNNFENCIFQFKDLKLIKFQEIFNQTSNEAKK